MWSSVVVDQPQKIELNGNPIAVTLSVYRRGQGVFPVTIGCDVSIAIEAWPDQEVIVPS